MSDDKPRDDESFASLFEAETRGVKAERSRPLALGELCRAELVQVGKDAVFVEVLGRATLGKRPQAYLQLDDAEALLGKAGLKPGTQFEAMVVEIDARSGEVRLGHGMGRPSGLEALETAHAAQVAVEGKVTGVNKGGLEVEVGGVRAFCPISHADRGYVADPQALIGRALSFLVVELGEGGKRVVLSRRALLEREAKEKAAATLATLAPGSTVRGSVSAVREFGAFVDLGGIEGLIPNAELSHERGARAADLLAPGDAVEVQVREIKPGEPNKRGEPTLKITLSLKALRADPWDEIEQLAPEGVVLQGSVTRTADFGAFVRLAPGVEGLLHVSELAGKPSHPSALLKAGDALAVVVRSVDRAAHRIALELAPEGLLPGKAARAPSLAVGMVVEGTVDRVEPFGVFLQVAGTRGRAGRGLIPNAELGTPRGADTRKLFPAGMKLSAKVLETGEGKLRLSLRAIKDDEERADYDGYRASQAVPSRLGTLGDLLKKK